MDTLLDVLMVALTNHIVHSSSGGAAILRKDSIANDGEKTTAHLTFMLNVRISTNVH